MNCIIASSSTVYGTSPLTYLFDTLKTLYKSCSTILFIPYARPGGITHDEYTLGVHDIFKTINKQVKSIHSFETVTDAFENTDGIYVGGGNTFVLVDQLYRKQVMAPLRQAIQKGVPYLGTSAGSNICGLTMQTTNDMPIVCPSSFKTLGIVSFNINPHYVDPDPNSKHKGETRETRIKEFHNLNPQPVVGLREGSWLNVSNDNIVLEGGLSARIFEKNKTSYEVASGTSLTDLN